MADYAEMYCMKKYIPLLLCLSACGGSAGSNGSNGSNGANGTNGTAGLTVSSELYCSVQDSGIGTTLAYTYEIVKYSTGDRQVTCTVANGNYMYSNTMFWRAIDGGATSGYCSVNYDIVGSGGGGFWSFTSTGGVNQTVYSGATHNGYTYTYTGGQCNPI